MADTEQRKPEDNHGSNVQIKPAENALSLRKNETPVGSTYGDEINLDSNVSPDYHNSQQSPIIDSTDQITIQGVRVTEATASTAGEEEKQAYTLILQDIANKEAEAALHNEHVPKTADPLNNMTSSVQTLPDEINNVDSSSQPNYAQAKNENGKQIQGPNNQSADSDVSTKSMSHNNEKPLDEAGQQEQQGSTNLSNSTLKEERHSLTMKKEAVDEGAHTCRSFKDQEGQCGEDQVNEGKKIPKALDKFRSDALSHIVAGIALAVALYTQFISIPNLKQATPLQIDSGHCPQVLESMKVFRKRLDSVESSIQDSIASIKGFEERFKKLKAVAYKDDTANLVQKTNFEDRVRETEQNFLDQVSAKVEENTNLQNQFLKLKDEVSMLFEGNSGIKNKQEELKTNVMTLEDKLGKQSQYVGKKTAKVEKEMSQHKEAVRDLNVSLENLESNIKYLTENVTGISIETLVLDKRSEDIKENIFDKGSLIVVIMMDTVLIVVVIIYLAAKGDNNRHLNWNVQEVNGGVNYSPAPYSTAGRILSQVRAHLRLENKLCVISFYEETHPLHMRMTQSVTDQLTIQPVEFIIRRHDDILNIPPVVLFFLFVDFNERNVILEDPTLELGDLRLNTVQAVQKMGGKIVIFYVRDQISKQLDSTKLYNEDLVSVTRQRELSDLNRRSRFISAYDQLTDFQKTYLKRIVGNELAEGVRGQNGRMFDEIIRNFASEKKVKNILLVGLPSVGKSSLINSLACLILGKYVPVASVGQGTDQLTHTYATYRYNHFGISEEHLRGSPNEDNARIMHPHLPNLYDFVGLSDENTEELKEILSLQIFGHLEPGLQITSLFMSQRRHGVGSLRSWYTKSVDDWKIDVVFFLHSVTTSEVPKELIQCILDVIKPKDTLSPVDVEFYVVLTKMDKVETGVVTEENVIAIENDVADLFGIHGFKEYKLVKMANWCDVVGFPNSSADNLDGLDELSVTSNNQLLKLLRNMSTPRARSKITHDITFIQKMWFYLYGYLTTIIRIFHFEPLGPRDILYAVLFSLILIIVVFLLML